LAAAWTSLVCMDRKSVYVECVLFSFEVGEALRSSLGGGEGGFRVQGLGFRYVAGCGNGLQRAHYV